MADFISEIRERRVLPALGVYVGSVWVLIEILDRLVERYLLSPYLTDIAFWGLFSLIPAVVLIAWTHGQPGKDEITTAEKVGVPINLIATIGLVITLFADKDLGATAEWVTISDEHGETVSQLVASESHRRKMAVFFWENQTGQPENDWLAYALPEMLASDLQQSPFAQVTSPWNSGPNGIYLQMKQAGFDDGLGLPTGLKRRIASNANRDFFVDGAVARQADQWVLTANVWDSGTATVVGTVEETGEDLYGLVDRISLGVREVLDVPTGSGKVEDLAIADTYGESREALQAYIKGMNAWLFENDMDQALAHLDDALERDRQFVLAWFIAARLHAEQGDLAAAEAAYDAAQEMDYRLPAIGRMLIKANQFLLAGETEKLESFLRMNVRLNDDIRSRTVLANVLLGAGKIDEARDLYVEALEIDPSEIGMLLGVANIDWALKDYESAIDHFNQFLEVKPKDVDANLMLGDLHREMGEFDNASEAYEQALFVSTGNIQPLVRLSYLAISRGHSDEALELLSQAAEDAEAPDQKSAIASAQNFFHQRAGRISRAIEVINEQIQYDREFLTPLTVVLSHTPELIKLNLFIGRIDRAQEIQEQALDSLSPPMNEFLAFNEAMIQTALGNLDAARNAVARGAEVLERFQLSQLEFQVTFALAHIEIREGNHLEAAAYLEETLEQVRISIISGVPGLMAFRSDLIAWLAQEQVFAGDLEAARNSIENGFRLDPSNPNTWLAQAELQLALNEPDMAAASINYALAIWKDADPEFDALQQAKALKSRIETNELVSN
ncbi:MAG TPA: tetratricopeptide repeat protein [Xanthomonadales bacterium]|nr:tetratricopeptide repeat protein [Xanthomonadales bacterium]